MGIAYPTTLPQAPQRNGFNQQQTANTIRSNVDVGEAKVRRRYTYAMKKERWSMILDDTQTATFNAWFNDDLKSGVLRFDFPDTLTQVTEEYRILDMPIFTPFGKCGSYMISFNVEQVV